MRPSLLALILFGAAPLVQPRVAAAQCTFSPPIGTLNDGGGFAWDIDGAGRVQNGTIDAFDIGMAVQIDGTYFPVSPTTLTGRELVVGPTAMAGLSITRKVYVSSTQSWARWVDLYSNPTNADITVDLLYETNSGADSGRQVVTTSSGDAVFSTGDAWLVTDDASDGGGDPTVAENLHDGRTFLQPDLVGNAVFDCAATNGTMWRYSSFTVPAGRTAALMTLVSQNPNRASAASNAAALQAQDAGLEGLSPADRGAIRNRLLPKTVLFVSDSATDAGIPAALTADGHLVTTLTGQFQVATGATTALVGPLSAYDAVIWSATGQGSGSVNSDSAMYSNLTLYVAGGGRLYVTGYDSVASPDDPVLAQFVGGLGPVQDVPSAPGPIASILSSVTRGLVDLRGVQPAGYASDRDALVGLAAGTLSLVQTATVPTQTQWALRALGAGEIAYISNGNSGGGPSHGSWVDPTNAYNASLRNFVFGAVGAVPNQPPLADAGGPYIVSPNVALPLDGSGSSDLDGTIVTYAWDCTDDGVFDVNSGSSTGSVCTYASPGAFTLRLRVTDNDGDLATATATVTVTNTPPVAMAGGPYSGPENTAIALSGAASSDSDGFIASYAWDCTTDGSVDSTSSSPTTTCTYADQGAFTATLVVTDSNGATASATASVTVFNVAPFFTSVVAPSVGDEGAILAFSAGVSDVAAGDILDLAVTWSWGDGTADTAGTSATHTYIDDGAWTVTVTVVDLDGGVASQTVSLATLNVDPTITTTPGPTAQQGVSYSYLPTVTDPGDEVFDWVLIGAVSSNLVFDAATGAISWVPDSADAAVGSFALTLQVNDGDGGSFSQSWTVVVTSADSDGDGMSDDWESDNGLNPNDPNDGALDPDADGMTNLDEFGLGTDPFDSNGPDAPTLVAPIAGELVDSSTPLLRIDNATDPDLDVLTYTFEVYADAAMTVLLDSDDTVAEAVSGQTEWTVTVGLTENAEVFWRAAASDAFVRGPFTGLESFFVNALPEAPAVPVLVYPIQGEIAASVTPTLQWAESLDPEGDTVSYDLELLDAAGALLSSASGLLGDGVTGEWLVDVVLGENGWYSWSVKATDAGGLESAWSASESFQVSVANEAPDGVIFVEPIDGQPIAVQSPDLVATESQDPEGGAVVYRFEIDGSPGFDSPDSLSEEIAHTGSGLVVWELDAAGIQLRENRITYARVRAIDEDGVSSAPDTISFFVRGQNDGPTVPVLLSPADGAEGSGVPELLVEDPEDPEGDTVEVEFVVARDAELLDVLVTSGWIPVTAEGSTGWTLDLQLDAGLSLDADVAVFWSARAHDTLGAASEWATPWAYRVPGPGGDDDDDDDDAPVGCACGSDLARPATVGWVWLALLPLAASRRRR